MNRRLLVVMLIGASLMLSTSVDAAVVLGNDRPLPVAISTYTGGGGAPTLADLAAPYGVSNVNTQQLSYDYFTLPYGTSVAEFSIAFSFFTNASPVQQMGIYNLHDTGQELILLNGTAPESAINPRELLVLFNVGGVAGNIQVLDLSTFTLVSHLEGWSGAYEFGFWATPYGLPKYYLDDERNTEATGPGMASDGTSAYGLVYQATGGYLFAFDYNNSPNSARDFNDLVFKGQSIQPVPEPGTMMLLGSGLIGIAAWGRRRLKK